MTAAAPTAVTAAASTAAYAPGSVLGIDIGGTSIVAGVVRLPRQLSGAATVRGLRRRPTPSGAAAILATCVELADLELGSALRADHPVAAIGIGAPGLVDPDTGSVGQASAVIPGWRGARVAQTIGAATGLPVAVDNDVRAFGLAEATFGAGRALRRCLHVAFGTGVGGAVTVDGRLPHSPRGSLGELAHLTVPVTGAHPCGCGRYQHLESVASGPAMAAAYAARTGRPGSLTLHDVRAAREAGDPDAIAVVRAAAETAGECLAGVVGAFDLDGVVVGGGAIGVDPGFVPTLAAVLRGALWPPGRPVEVAVGDLGAAGPVIGAALLAAGRNPRRERS